MMDDVSRSVHPYPPDITSEVHDVHVTDHNGRQISGGSWVCCMPCYWLRTNSSLHKASLTVVTLLVTSLLVASPVLFLISSVPANEQPYKDCSNIDEVDCFVEKTWDTPLDLCDTLDCVDIARRLRLSLSWNRDPCKDFFSFACGSWGDNPNHLEDDLSFTAVQNNINNLLHHLIKSRTSSGKFKKIGDFYLSCLAALSKPTDMSQIYKVMDQLGGYLPPGSIGPSDLTPLIINILKLSGTPLFDVYLSQDLKMKTHTALFIDIPKDIKIVSFFDQQPDFLNFNELDSNMYGRKEAEPSNNYKYIKDKILENKLYRLESIVSGMLPKGMVVSVKGSEIQQILLFATAVEQLKPRQKELRRSVNNASHSDVFSIEMLQETFPFVTWKVLFDEMVPGFNLSECNIFLTSKSYLTSVSELVSRFQNRVIQNALLAMYARDFLYTLANLTTTISHQKFCTKFTKTGLSLHMSALYLDHYTDTYLQEVQKNADNLFYELKHSLSSLVERASWLDEDTRRKLINKLTNMKGAFIGWPLLRNESFVDEIMNSLIVTDSFFENMLNQFRDYRILRMNVSANAPEFNWPAPFTVNAFYYPEMNKIILPLALLTQPHFTSKVPEYVSYGTIGLVMSHEMLHALDFNLAGHSVSPLWADSKSLKALKARLGCLVRSYQTSSQKVLQFMGKKSKIEFDGNSTMDENTADLGAVGAAWGAWMGAGGKGSPSLSRLPLAPGKLFFLFTAQLYCNKFSPEEYIVRVENDLHMTAPERVNGMLRNTPAFAEAFQCPVGSSMNPSRKCIIW